MDAGNNSVDKLLGHQFKDHGLIKQALTHPSMEGEENYQRLEFLGDRVLGVIIADLLYERFPVASEGELAHWLNTLVCRDALASVCRHIGLDEYLRLSEGEERSGGRRKDAILADCCEAVIGALYLDGGMKAALQFVRSAWEDFIVTAPEGMKDAKTVLQELVQAQGMPTPSYTEIERKGPDHAPQFTMQVSVGGNLKRRGRGPSKQAAEQEAARKMLSHLRIGGKE